MDGFLNLAKPGQCTSRDIVNVVQRLVRPAKVGHAGTLDPLAQGVLVVAVGQATKLIERVQRSPKTYRGTFLLGRSSDSEDIEGEIVELQDPPIPDEPALRQACAKMEGEIEQMPPQFSALKVNGKRAYALAREGKRADLKPRTIRIDECRLLSYAYPQFELLVRCGSGAYIRSLGRDIAQQLGTAAVMSALTRLAVGEFALESAVDPQSLSAANLADALQPLSTAVAELPQCVLDEQESALLGNGQQIVNRFGLQSESAAFLPDGRLAAIVSPVEGNRIRTRRNFTYPA